MPIDAPASKFRPAIEAASDNGLEVSGPPGAACCDVDFKRNTCQQVAFVSTKGASSVAGAKTKQIAAGNGIKVTHRGTYQHVGNS